MKSINILVPIDFSSTSANAARIAVEIAQILKGNLLFHHAWPAYREAAVYAEGYVDPVIELNEKEIIAQFDDFKSKIIGMENVPYTFSFSTAPFLDSIEIEISNKKVDLIISGTRSNHSILERFLGTNSADVMRRISHIPVLVIPDSIKYFKPNRVAIALDAKSLKDLPPFTIISDLIRLNGSKLEIFYVNKENEFIDFKNSIYRDIFETFFDSIPFTFHNVKGENINESIKSFCEEHQIDMIITFPRSHGLFYEVLNSSISRKIAQTGKFMTLSLHE